MILWVYGPAKKYIYSEAKDFDKSDNVRFGECRIKWRIPENGKFDAEGGDKPAQFSDYLKTTLFNMKSVSEHLNISEQITRIH